MSTVDALPSWEVHVVEYARSHRQAMASLVFGTFEEPPVDVPFSFVVARRPGRVVLVDCGFMKEKRGLSMAEKFAIPNWVSPLRMLAALGVAAEDVTDIVLSHAHFDHMGSIDQFPRAQLYLQKSEMLSWVEILALPKRFSFLSEVLNPDDLLAAMAASIGHRLTLIEGDKDDLLPGLHVRLAPGHTMGQQFILLDTAKGRYAVSGDCIYSARNITGRDDCGCYLPLGAGIGSVWDQLKSIDRLNEHVGGDLSRIIILHDFARWTGHTQVAEVEGFGIFKVC